VPALRDVRTGAREPRASLAGAARGLTRVAGVCPKSRFESEVAGKRYLCITGGGLFRGEVRPNHYGPGPSQSGPLPFSWTTVVLRCALRNMGRVFSHLHPSQPLRAGTRHSQPGPLPARMHLRAVASGWLGVPLTAPFQELGTHSFPPLVFLLSVHPASGVEIGGRAPRLVAARPIGGAEEEGWETSVPACYSIPSVGERAQKVHTPPGVFSMGLREHFFPAAR
jgi:hypothetical protein